MSKLMQVVCDTSQRDENWRATDDNASTYHDGLHHCQHYHDGCYKVLILLFLYTLYHTAELCQ